MFTVIVDLIWLMHCHGCRLGQVLLVIKWMCWPPRLFQVGDGSGGVEGRLQGFFEGFTGLGTAVALCVFYSLHRRKTISTVSSRECFVQGGYSLRCMLGTLV